MKAPSLRILGIAACTTLFSAASAQQTKTKVKTEPGKTKVKTETLKPAQPAAVASNDGLYTATYSDKFVAMPNPEHTEVVMRVWRFWEDNAINKALRYFDKDVQVTLADGELITNVEHLHDRYSQMRDSFEKSQFVLESITPLRSINRNENWVAIWGVQEDFGRDGSRTRKNVHELWRFNSANKVDRIRRYTSAAAAE